MNLLGRKILKLLKQMKTIEESGEMKPGVWGEIAEKLNNEGVRNLTGKEWSPLTLSIYFRSHLKPKIQRENSKIQASTAKIRTPGKQRPGPETKDAGSEKPLNHTLTVIDGGANGVFRPRRKKGEKALAQGELSEREILQAARKILEETEPYKKPWTGGKTKRLAPLKTGVIAARIPADLINEINALKKSKSYHLERAVRFYLRVLKAT